MAHGKGNLGIFRLATTVITLIMGGWRVHAVGRSGGGRRERRGHPHGVEHIRRGVLCLVMTFYALSRIKPELKGGIYSYANAGLRRFPRLNSAWGYWISALLCTVSFSALLFGALAYFFPVFGEGTQSGVGDRGQSSHLVLRVPCLARHQRGHGCERRHHHLEVSCPSSWHHGYHLFAEVRSEHLHGQHGARAESGMRSSTR